MNLKSVRYNDLTFYTESIRRTNMERQNKKYSAMTIKLEILKTRAIDIYSIFFSLKNGTKQSCMPVHPTLYQGLTR